MRSIAVIQTKPCQNPTSSRTSMAAFKHGNQTVLMPDIGKSKLPMGKLHAHVWWIAQHFMHLLYI